MAGAGAAVLNATERLSGLSDHVRGSLGSSSSSSSEVEADLQKLGSVLRSLLAVIEDAESREDQSIKRWLLELKLVAFDAEDVLDDLEFELLLRSQVEHGDDARVGEKRKKKKLQVGDDSRRARIHEPSFQNDVKTRIKEIRVRLEEIEKERRTFHLREEDGRRRVEAPVRPPTAALVDESRVHGRDYEKEWVIDQLLSEELDTGCFTVVSIVGMGGLGKTTLAQMVYKDSRVQGHFQLRSWVHVSENFDVVRLTRATVQSITKKRSELVELDSLQEELESKVSGNRFLLVLDDVWNEEQCYWDTFKLPLMSGSKRSRILVTTRAENVSSIMGTRSMHRLKHLSDGCCWSLFSQYAFRFQSPAAQPNLAEIGLQIARKCKGLPLTVKVLGGLLCCETDEHVWDSILRSDMWDVNEGNSQILPALRLSYQHLSAHLRQCFAYCAIFPKAHSFDRNRLIWMWIAQGFIHSEEREQLEDVAHGYFDDLLRVSFFQCSEDEDGTEIFEMHDLIHGLAQSASQGECCRIEEGNMCNISRDARHSSVVCYDWQSPLAFMPPAALKVLRTVMFIDNSDDLADVNFVDCLLLKMQHLRVLDLSEVDIDELPDSVGNLKHLRYLGLGGTNIVSLPESVGDLYYLQTLELEDCYPLELPKSINNLFNLHHLVLDTVTDLRMMPHGIGKLTNLQTLPIFVVGKDHGSASIAELRDLKNIRGKLFILGLQNTVHNQNDAKVANLKSKKHLKELMLQWDNGDDDDDDAETVLASEHDEEMLENLEPHRELEVLAIGWKYRGTKFPTWLGDPSFSNLKSVVLRDCIHCEHLPPLGQLPSLGSLSIIEMKSVKCADHMFFGDGMINSFPSLLFLNLQNMPQLEELWDMTVEGHKFPCLSYLKIDDCPKLKSLSLHNLGSLEELYVQDCTALTSIDCLSSCSFVKQLQHQLTSLKRLELLRCPNLQFSPDEQLPSLLCTFYVYKCPLVEEWSKAHASQLTHIDEPQVSGKELSLREVNLVEKARAENLKCDEDLKKLELGWYVAGNIKYGDPHEEILECLEPNTNLEELLIEGYLGWSFASWVGDPSFSKLMKVSLSDCTKCESLPPLGQLPSLKKLTICGMEEVKLVGQELFGYGEFRSLEKLQFLNMPKWEEWQGVEAGSFPCLRKLVVKRCPRLKGIELALRNISSSYKLRIRDFDNELILNKLCQLTSCITLSISHFPNLREVLLNFLPQNVKEIEIEDCRRLTALPKFPPSIRGLVLAEYNETILQRSSTSFSSLSYLYICHHRNLTSLPLDNLSGLRELHILNCEELVSLDYMSTFSPRGVHALHSLRLLSIKGCPKLIFAAEEQLPPKLQFVSISDSPLLANWFQGEWHKFNDTIKIWIDGLPVLTHDYQCPDGFSVTSIEDAIACVRCIE